MPNPYTGTDNDPFQEAQHNYLGPAWAAYFKALQGKRLAPQGKGIGASLGLLPSPRDAYDDPRIDAENFGLNLAQDARRMGPANAPLQRVEAELAGMREQSDIKRALAIANDPNTSAHGRQIAAVSPMGVGPSDRPVSESGTYTTLRPNPNEAQPPVNRQAIAAQMAPGLIAPPAEQAQTKVTFGEPKIQMVDGKRTLVRAGSDGLTYDMARRPVDPATIAPLDPEADSAKPYFTYQATFDPQGRPTGAIRFDARGGPPVKVDVEGVTGGQLKPPPGTTGTQALVNEASTAQLDRLKTMFDAGAKDTIGPVEGRARAIGQQIPGVSVNKTFADFDAASSAFRNSVIKAITGAAMGEREADRIMKQIPSETDKPDVWLSKYEQSKKNLADLDAVLSKKGGATAPPVAPPAGADIPEGTRKPIPGGGGVAEFRGGKWIRVG